jgi:uncharacterized protein YbjT (DUF2867 family)
MRIAVLGAGGFLGSHLVPALLARTEAEIDAVDVTFGKLAPTATASAGSRPASIARAWSTRSPAPARWWSR